MKVVIRVLAVGYVMLWLTSAEAICLKTKKCYRIAKKNSIAVIPGMSSTKIVREGMTFKTKHELDVGVMYQRDLSHRYRMTIIGTKNTNLYMGLGYKF